MKMTKTDFTLTEAQRLYSLGFGILWLHPKSKRPIGNKWTEGPRKTWPALLAEYRPGMNVGVRTGLASKVGAGYLACIDVDVKDPACLEAANLALEPLIGGGHFPEVRSGGGHGSCHIYYLSPTPFKMMTVEKHPGWEICIYSEGRQMVLPPSTHPKTDKPYRWIVPLEDVQKMALREFGPFGTPTPHPKSPKTGERPDDYAKAFLVTFDEALDIRWDPRLSEKLRSQIVSGTGVEDRSAALLPLCSKLLKAGFDRDGILTVLTDSSLFMGQCAFDHAQTQDRTTAARWLWRYTLAKVMEEQDVKGAFARSPIEELDGPGLNSAAAAAQNEEMAQGRDWKNYLDKNGNGFLRATFSNCQVILEHSAKQKNIIGRDEFAVQDFLLCETDWGGKEGEAITDGLTLDFKVYCVKNFKLEFKTQLIEEVFQSHARRYRFNPVRDYLESLVWDEIPRIDTWLADYAGATGPDSYLRAVSRKVLVAMVKRIYEPGCKFDYVLVLEGLQGTGKSSLLGNLASPWFTDETLNIGDKDAVLTMQSKWVIELGELSTLSRAETENTKAFVSRKTDRIRAPYGRRVEEYPRQCIFIGSTNKDEYLKDETGNRRFWPVKTGRVHPRKLKEMRDQLFAEAVEFYKMGEEVYLEKDEVEDIARVEQIRRGERDEWIEPIQEIIEAEDFPREGFTMRDVSKLMTEYGAHKLTHGDQRRIAKCFHLLGCERFQETAGSRRKMWRKPEMVDSRGSEPLTNP